MKTIVLEVDEVTGNGFESLSPEDQQQFRNDATQLLRKILSDARSVKLKKIIEEIRNEGKESTLNPEMFVELLLTEL